MKTVSKRTRWAVVLLGTVAPVAIAQAGEINIPAGTLGAALDAYAAQTGIHLLYAEHDVSGVKTKGVAGDLTPDGALTRLLSGTGFVVHKHSPNEIAVVRDMESLSAPPITSIQIAQATPARASVETVTVTSSKLGGADVQSIPISITALSQEQLTATQTAGGPDLVKQVPNLTFTKTNFSGYSIQIRGIGTQAISVTTDPAVAVAMNDMPFIRNHFFEQEFYDVGQVEVLRGPQGTLYGRNSTAGVVNVITNKPTDQFEAMASADLGNYHNRRFEGMLNLPIVDDRFDLRVAGEWTKRDGYSFNETTDKEIDGRDLWSGRVTLGLRPLEHLKINVVWEHFQEDDDRLRSAKQLCKTDYGPGGTATNGIVNIGGVFKPVGVGALAYPGDYFTQGCAPSSLYSSESFEAPLGFTLPYVLGLQTCCSGAPINPYASETQSRDLRVINSDLDPTYRAKNDTLELTADYNLSPQLMFTSQTGYNDDFLWSLEDYNRFGSVPGIFNYQGGGVNNQGVMPGGIVCDPQLGCSDRLLLEDLSTEHAWQFNQEFRLASSFSGPLNFSAGANYLHYETVEKYYVFGNVLTTIDGGFFPGLYDSNTNIPLPNGYQFNDPTHPVKIAGGYVDPNPVTSLDDNGHNYFLSKNPYVLNSYALFGEANYELSDEFKVTGGLRWTDDQKHFLIVPSWLLDAGWGYPVAGTTDQDWSEFTGRAVVNWTPKLEFTDQTLVYGSYSHGYKAGGANPPGALFSSQFQPPTQGGGVQANLSVQPIHPLTFKPEFIDAFEAGTKNTLLDGALTLNGDVFFYKYQGYQISEIVDRTAINRNFDAKVKGAELETSWEPLPGLKFKFAGGYEDTKIDNGQSAVDLMDRTAGNSNWVLVKPFVNEASNCVFPVYVAKYFINSAPVAGANSTSYCGVAYTLGLDPLTLLPYTPNPSPSGVLGSSVPPGYPGYDPLAGTPGDPYTGQNKDPATGIDYGPVPNDGAGFSKNVGGNELPNAPHFTTSLSADYTLPVSTDWAATLHGDFYWQSQSWWRVFNDKSYDRLEGYTNVNLALIFTNSNGWQTIAYVKNVFDTTAITGAFLNSDDSGLTTNVFLTDPRLFGVRITKNW